MTTEAGSTPPGADSDWWGSQRVGRLWTLVTLLEVIAASAAVLLDLLVPTFILLFLAIVSLVIRREHFGSLGFRRPTRGWQLVVKMLGFAAAWSAFQLAVLIPIANHLSGSEQDLSAFKDLKGNFGLLVALLALSWTLAAVGEEAAYRGYLQTRMTQLFESRRIGLVFGVLALVGALRHRPHRTRCRRRHHRHARRHRVQRRPLSLPHHVGVRAGARIQQHDRIPRVLPGRPDPRLLVAGPGRRTLPGVRPTRRFRTGTKGTPVGPAGERAPMGGCGRCASPR